MNTVANLQTPVRLAARAVGVEKVYGQQDTAVRALDGVSVDFPAGQFTAVMGPSGSGKSTLMHCLAALDRPTAGQIFLGDTDLTGMKDKQLTLLRRDRIGFVFQAFNLLPQLNAQENMLLPLRLAGRKPDQDWLDQVVATVGLGDTVDAVAHGGAAAARSRCGCRRRRRVGPRR
ncbi:MAG: ABC transporter ATP-binding protein [Euzebya sp.]